MCAITWFTFPALSSHLFRPQPLVPGYIGEFEIVDDHRGGKIVIDLIGRINKVGVISPRFDVKYGEYENWVNNVLPSRQVSRRGRCSVAGAVGGEESRTGPVVLALPAFCVLCIRAGRWESTT